MIGPTDPSLVVLVLIAVSLSGVISDQTFPAVEDTTPWEYQTKFKEKLDNCEKKSAEDIKRELRDTLPRGLIHNLRLNQCNLTEIPGDMFEGLQIETLMLLNNSISSVHKNTFDPLASSLEVLDLIHNRLTEIPVEALLSLRKLKTLLIIFEKIEEIPARAFSELKKLNILSLYNNKISKIDENAFEGIQFTLTELDLGNNSLTSVPVNALHNLTHLKRLKLYHNRITKLTKEDFQDLTALEILDLSNNLIETLPSQLFNNNMVFNSLYLRGNMIETISNDAFIKVADTLEWLNLGENRLGKIPVEALRPLYRLENLDLSQNNISVIPENAFNSFRANLTFLYLDRNSIKHISPLLFSTMSNLEWLYLSHNQLQRIPMETYQPILDKLNLIDLYDNPFICDCHVLWFREWLSTSNRSHPASDKCIQCHEPSSLRYQTLGEIPEIHFTCPMYQSPDSSQKNSEKVNCSQ